MEPTVEELLSRCRCPSCRDAAAAREASSAMHADDCACPACLACLDEAE